MSRIAIRKFRADGTYLYAEITWNPADPSITPVAVNIPIKTGMAGIGVIPDSTVQGSVSYIALGIYPGDYPHKDVLALPTQLTGAFPLSFSGAKWPSINVRTNYVINPLGDMLNGFSVSLGTVPPESP